MAGAEVTNLGRFELEKDKPIFWDGPPDLDNTDLDPGFTADQGGRCDQTRPCIEYELVVPELSGPAYRLRVAHDTADDFDPASGVLNPPAEPTDNGDGFEIYLIDPAGSQQAYAGGRYSGEAAVRGPMPGTWKVWVGWGLTNSDSTFRMRAKLETHPPSDTGDKLLLPNLRLTPPFEFVAGLQFEAGVAPTGCLAPELLPRADGGESATNCLRFSFGPENVGGPLELIVGRPGCASTTGGTVVQRIYRRDGSFEEREAGTYEFHPEHLHFHVDHYSGAVLYRVTDPRTGGLVPAGPGHKQGFCTADYAIARWRSFANDPTNDPGPGQQGTCTELAAGLSTGGLGGSPFEEAVVALSPGWADVYAYYLEGNYVEFGDNPSGEYVVRVRANDQDAMHETTTADNYSYAHIRVAREPLTGVIAVTDVIERGYGTDPWDPHKRIATDIRNDFADD